MKVMHQCIGSQIQPDRPVRECIIVERSFCSFFFATLSFPCSSILVGSVSHILTHAATSPSLVKTTKIQAPQVG
jgi:hypothetical protein